MPQSSNLEIVMQLFADYLAGNVPAVMAVMADDVTWIEPGAPQVPFGGTYKGHAGVGEMFGLEAKLLEVTSFSPDKYFADGDMVVVLGTDSANVIATGKAYASSWAMAFTLNDTGMVTNVQTYMDTESIANAFIPSVE